MKAIYSITLLVTAVLLLAFNAPAQAAKNMDNAIEKAAKQSYVFKTYLKSDDIKIKSKDGAVTLTGDVYEDSHKSLAEETVAGLPGVKSVNNMLEVKGDRPADKPDAWLLTKVKTTLLFHRSVSSMTEVDVKDGVVILRGEADNQAQKELTSEYAMDIEGVKDVRNEMTVAKSGKKTKTQAVGDQIDDTSITALVKTTLLYHRSTSGIKTKVETKAGVVTLTGKAKNSAEIDLATKLAKDVNGVKAVENRMTVE